MDNANLNETEMSEHNSTLIKSIEFKLRNILYSVNFCGVCFEPENDLCSLNAEFQCFGRYNQIKTMKDAVEYLFYDVNVPATEYLCNKCKETIVEAYRFIEKAKETTKLINNYVNDFVSKTIDLNNQLEPNCSYEDSNVIIVLENHEETNETPIEIKVLQTKTKKLETLNIKRDEVAQKLENSKKKIAATNNSELVAKKAKVEAKLIKEKETKIQQVIPIVKNMISRTEGYECTKCKVTFTTFKHWKEHEKDFHKKAVECETCFKTFESHRVLIEHYKLHNKLKCRICNNFVLDTKLTEHLKLNHENETHSCEYCDKVYYTAPALIAHVKISHFKVETVDEGDENPQCLMCLQYFKKDDLRTHKCRDKCPDCTEIPCIHYKYLIHFKEQVLNHMNKIKCLDCDYMCRRKDSLIAHVNREHIDYHPFKCSDCGTQFFSRYRLKCHISAFHKETINCEYCDKVFNNQTLYNRHVSLCKIERRQFACQKCMASFITADELCNHDKIKHSDEIIPCDLCNKIFLTEENMEEHKLRSHRSVQMRKQMKWECLLCDKDKKFDTKGEYRQHMESHGPDVKYICKICSIECKDLQNLQWHNRSHRKKVKKPEKCTICDKAVMSLRTHMFRHKILNKSSLQCICDKCGKTFLSKTQLRVHRTVHLDRVPCKVCFKPVKPSTMYKHMCIHKGIPIKKQGRRCTAVCEYCDYIPQNLPSLEAHVNRYHLNIKPYICDVCGEAFCTGNALKQHAQVHSNEKKYTCELCDNKFRFRNSLRKHMFLHTGEKSHICDICGDRFICSSSLNEHRLKHMEKSIGCPLCEAMFHSMKLMRMHFKKQHWKDKDRKFNPKEILDEEYHYLFEDRRKVKIDVYNSG